MVLKKNNFRYTIQIDYNWTNNTNFTNLRFSAAFLHYSTKYLFPKELCEYNMLCIMFKLEKCLPVEYFKNYFVLRSHTHSYPTSLSVSGNLAHNYIPNTNFGYATFHYRAISLWNKLPNEIRDCSTLSMFKIKLKKYMLNTQKSRLGIS